MAPVTPTLTSTASSSTPASTTAVPITAAATIAVPITTAATPGATTAAPGTGSSSAEGLADALTSALAQSDYVRLQGLITPTGWQAGFYQGGGAGPMTPTETIDWLRTRAPGGRIQAVVQPRPILPHAAPQPPGDTYINSTWTNFASTPTQKAELTMRTEAGIWYWSGALFDAPAR